MKAALLKARITVTSRTEVKATFKEFSVVMSVQDVIWVF
jgi:hypothetical protein